MKNSIEYAEIKSTVQSSVTKGYNNLKGRLILFPFFDWKFNQKTTPEKYDFLFCTFGLIILPKHYKPILTLRNQTTEYFGDLKINNCNYLNQKIDIVGKKVELEVSGFGTITRIRIVVSLESSETAEEMGRLIDNLKTDATSDSNPQFATNIKVLR